VFIVVTLGGNWIRDVAPLSVTVLSLVVNCLSSSVACEEWGEGLQAAFAREFDHRLSLGNSQWVTIRQKEIQHDRSQNRRALCAD
jgi:hypothetical protein